MKLDTKRLAEAYIEVGARLERMPAVEGKDWATRLAKRVADVDDFEGLIGRLDAGETEKNFGLALLLRASVVDPPTTRTSVEDLPVFDTDIGDVRVHHGDLVVEGDLVLEDSLIVTGNLEVGGVLDISPEWTTLLVIGDVLTRGAAIGQDQIMIGGALRVAEAITVMQGTVSVGDVFEAALAIEWLGDVFSAKEPSVRHRFGAEQLRSDARAVRAQLAAILAPDLFLPGDADDDVLSVARRVAERMASKESIFS